MSAATARILPAELAGGDPLVRRSERADFQSNIALAVAKRLGRPPHEVARRLADALDGRGVSASVSGPGFLNLTVPDTVVWSRIGERATAERLGVGAPLTGERVVVDYSAPNIAKELHVGHLRSTVIGDALARVLGFLGADVIRQNHLGDWGTQFGMLIQYLDEGAQGIAAAEISTLDALYRASQNRFEADPDFADRARSQVVALQTGDPATLAIWEKLVEGSERAFQALYRRMGRAPDTRPGAAHRAREGRRIRVRRNGSRHDPAPDPRSQGHPDPVSCRRPAGHAFPDDFRHRTPRRLAHR